MSDNVNKEAAEQILNQIQETERKSAEDPSSASDDTIQGDAQTQARSEAAASDSKQLKIDRDISGLFRWMEGLSESERQAFIHPMITLYRR